MSYRVLQLTNPVVGAVAADALMPLGAITRKLCCGNQAQRTFGVSTTGANTISLNDTGFYRVTYSVSAVAGAAGVVSIALNQNETALYTVSQTAAAAGDTVNLTLVYIVRVAPNCSAVISNLPANLQVVNTGVALTGGTSNILVEKVF